MGGLDFLFWALFALFSTWACLIGAGISDSNPGGNSGPEREEFDVFEGVGLMSALKRLVRGILGPDWEAGEFKVVLSGEWPITDNPGPGEVCFSGERVIEHVNTFVLFNVSLVGEKSLNNVCSLLAGLSRTSCLLGLTDFLGDSAKADEEIGEFSAFPGLTGVETPLLCADFPRDSSELTFDGEGWGLLAMIDL